MSHLRQFYLDWPHEISIETYAKCNASCVFCPYTTLERIGSKLSDEVLDRIIEELKDHPWPFMIAPFKINEPLLDKRLLPFCRKVMAELPKANLRIFSNGTTLTETNLLGIAALERVVHLWISLNDHRPEVHRKLMGINFEQVASNLDTLHTLKMTGQFTHDVVVSKVRHSVKADPDDEAFWGYVNERWPQFSVHLIKPENWLSDVDWPTDAIPKVGCGRWYELNITATGEVALCCMDSEAKHKIGDVTKQSLFEIYNSPAYRERRVKNLSREGITPCNRCSY